MLIPGVIADSEYPISYFPFQDKFYGLQGISNPAGMTWVVYGSGNNTIYDLVIVDSYSSDTAYDSRYGWMSGDTDTGCNSNFGTSDSGAESDFFHFYADVPTTTTLTGLWTSPCQNGGMWCDPYPNMGEDKICNETIDISICELSSSYDEGNWSCTGCDISTHCVGSAFTRLYSNFPLSNLETGNDMDINLSSDDYYQLTAGKSYILNISSDGDAGTRGHVCMEGYWSSDNNDMFCADYDQTGTTDTCGKIGAGIKLKSHGNDVYIYDTVVVYPNGTAEEYAPQFNKKFKTYPINDDPIGIVHNMLIPGYGGQYFITDSDGYLYVYDEESDHTGTYKWRNRLDSGNTDPTGIWVDIVVKKIYVLDKTDKKMYIYDYSGDHNLLPIESLFRVCDLDPLNTQPYGIMSGPGFPNIFVTDASGYIYTYSANCNAIGSFPIFAYGNANSRGITPGFMGYDLITTIYVSDYDDAGVYLYNYSLETQTCLGEWINYIYYRIWDDEIGGDSVYDYDAYCTMPNKNWCVDGMTLSSSSLRFSPEHWGHAINDTHYAFFDMLFSCNENCNLTVTYCPYGCSNGQCLGKSDTGAENIDILINQLGQAGQTVKKGVEGIYFLWFPNPEDRMLFGFGIMIIIAIAIIYFTMKSDIKDTSGVFQALAIVELLISGVFIAFQIFPWYIGFIYIIPIAWVGSRFLSGGSGGK